MFVTSPYISLATQLQSNSHDNNCVTPQTWKVFHLGRLCEYWFQVAP